MNYIQVNIGRNISSTKVEMPLDDWEAFVRQVKIILQASIRDPLAPVEIHYGVGVYDGVKEDSAHISMVADVTPEDIEWIRGSLLELKKFYNQERIALITQSTLI